MVLVFHGNLTDGVFRPPLLTPFMLGGRDMLRGSVRVQGTGVPSMGYGVPSTGYRDTGVA